MTVRLLSQCNLCDHFRPPLGGGTETCAAFPDGIPQKVLWNQADHRNGISGDNGITWEPHNGAEFPAEAFPNKQSTGAASTVEAHLPGKHDQSSHGRKGRSKPHVPDLVPDKPTKRSRKKTAPPESPLAAGVKSGITAEKALAGGAVAEAVDLVTFKDGSRAVRKRSQDLHHPKTGELRVDAKHQADAEELGSIVARSMGISAPEVHRSSDNEVFMEYMTGRPAMDLLADDDGEDKYDQALADVRSRDDAVILAAFEAITDNTDRNDGNWLINDDGSVTSIDHGFAWSFLASGSDQPPLGTGPFVGLVAAGGRNSLKWRDNDLSPKDMATIRSRLEGMRADFDRRGRGDWLDASLTRLTEMEPYAKGTKVRLT